MFSLSSSYRLFCILNLEKSYNIPQFFSGLFYTRNKMYDIALRLFMLKVRCLFKRGAIYFPEKGVKRRART